MTEAEHVNCQYQQPADSIATLLRESRVVSAIFSRARLLLDRCGCGLAPAEAGHPRRRSVQILLTSYEKAHFGNVPSHKFDRRGTMEVTGSARRATTNLTRPSCKEPLRQTRLGSAWGPDQIGNQRRLSPSCGPNQKRVHRGTVRPGGQRPIRSFTYLASGPACVPTGRGRTGKNWRAENGGSPWVNGALGMARS